MANHGPNTNGSQFFIVTGPQGLALPPQFTIFGRVSSGAATVRKIASTPVGVNPGMNGELSLPLQEVTIKRVVIHETP
jgi:cyclophilin family peptidyl-prolyl cis-trans isomerase